MAKTWRSPGDNSLPISLHLRKKEEGKNGAEYEVKRTTDRVTFSILLANGSKFDLPAAVIMGGTRHGISFLERLDAVNGIPLDRPALLEGRYAYSLSRRALELSPGFELESSPALEAQIGRVLSPAFEQKCVTCHGQPQTLGAGKEGGVHCESCHGPASRHIAAVGTSNPRQGVINPAKLDAEQKLAVCAQCHTGFTYQSDPMPDDLLVSNQVNALRNAECFIQSGKKLTCTECHDPHEDSSRVNEKSVAACLSCHSASVKPHAAICPVNAKDACLGCHMPAVQKGSFHMTDHWIRVHPETGEKAGPLPANLRSEVQPVREFLRVLVTTERDKAESAKQQVANKHEFSQVAHDVSEDPSAPGGGYIGDTELAQMDSKLAAAAAHLQYGETSDVVDLGNRFVILSRLPRDFKYNANALFERAVALKEKGDLKSAVKTAQSALSIYPYLLRAMIFLATAEAESGDVKHASEILRFVVQTYPRDSAAYFNLGLTLGSQPAEQIAAFQRSIELDPDITAGYENLGAAFYTSGRVKEAADAFRKGLIIDPLSPLLNYNLGLLLARTGEDAEGNQRLALAASVNPEIAAKISSARAK